MSASSEGRIRYVAGADSNDSGIGYAAVQIGGSPDSRSAMPVRILAMGTALHDGGVDPTKYGTSKASRKKTSGVGRRTRTRRKNVKKVRRDLRKYLRKDLDLGKIVDNADELLSRGMADPWSIRAKFSTEREENDYKRKLGVVIAILHILNHRGWRSSWTSVSSVREASKTPSDYYDKFRQKVDDALSALRAPGRDMSLPTDGRLTVAETVLPLVRFGVKFRGIPKTGLSEERAVRDDTGNLLNTEMAKIHQSDLYYELKRIFEVQEIEKDVEGIDLVKISEIIFRQESPRNAVLSAEWCPLVSGRHRAPRSTLTFQRYRIATTIANLRRFDGLDDDGNRKFRKLNFDERQEVYRALTSKDMFTSLPTWEDVHRVLGVSPDELGGSGKTTEDGQDFVTTERPPYLETEYILRSSKFYKLAGPFREWWESKDRTDAERDIAIEYLGNAGIDPSEKVDGRDETISDLENVIDQSVNENEKVIVEMDKLRLPSGRGAFSTEAMGRLVPMILKDCLELNEAIHLEFGLPLNPDLQFSVIFDRTGNPMVDRTLRLTFSIFRAFRREYGFPELIVIESVRNAFTSPAKAKQYAKENRWRERERNVARTALVRESGRYDHPWQVSDGALLRYMALRRQGFICPYCGDHIDFETSELDHIVPLSGGGSTGDVHNLVAVCRDCNSSKNKQIFYKWASPKKQREVKGRINGWPMTGFAGSSKAMKGFKDAVKENLDRRTPYEAWARDAIEPTAWMARELAARLRRYLARFDDTDWSDVQLPDVRVMPFSGKVTAWARFEAQVEQNISWIGGGSEKNRMDLRHHAIDAAVLTMMRPSVAHVLALREAQRTYCREMDIDVKVHPEEDYRKVVSDNEGETALFWHWITHQAPALAKLVSEAAASGRIRVIAPPPRYRYGVGMAHKETVYKYTRRKVGDALSAKAIDKAATESLWIALTRHPDYDPVRGLPEDRTRTIRVDGTHLGPEDVIRFMEKPESLEDRKKRLTNTPGKAAPIDSNSHRVSMPAGSCDGWVEIGRTAHHARIYRIPNGRGGSTYGMLRVYQHDLREHQNEDLFAVELGPQSFSVRGAHPRVRKALAEGTAEYIGFLTIGDEVVFDDETAPFAPARDGRGSDRISKVLMAFPALMDHGPVSYEITGFPTGTRISLKPIELGNWNAVRPGKDESGRKVWGDGDLDKARHDIDKVYGPHNWTFDEVESMNKVLDTGSSTALSTIVSHGPTFVRRNHLGNVRWKCKTHLPVSWRLPEAPRAAWNGKVAIPRNKALEPVT